MADSIKLELKTILVDQNLKEIHDISALEGKKVTAIMEANKDKSDAEKQEEIYKASPPMYLGEALKNLISRIQPENAEESGDQWVWIKKIKNQINTAKGELDVTTKEIEELKKMMNKLKPEFVNAIINGQIFMYLKECEAKLTLASK